MELENHTQIPAMLWRTAIDEHRIAAAIVARIGYRLEGDSLRYDDEQLWQVSSIPWESPVGTMPPDDCFKRGGVDLMVFGSARAPRGIPTPKVEVRIGLGRFAAGVDVYGERVWAAGFGFEPKATAPVPFVERPLDLAHAYGGKQSWDGLEVPYVSNPDGKGYYIEAKNAINQPLPNIENPRQPIRSWRETPDPAGVGLCPSTFGPRVQRSVELDHRHRITRLKPTFFNAAFPDLVAPAVEPGDRFFAAGVCAEAPVAFAIPASPLQARIAIGHTDVWRTLEVDQIGLAVDQRRVFITYRFPFRYAVIAMQPRACELHWSTGLP